MREFLNGDRWTIHREEERRRLEVTVSPGKPRHDDVMVPQIVGQPQNPTCAWIGRRITAKHVTISL